MGYETPEMNRATLVETTYKAVIALNRLLEQNKLITARRRRHEEERLKQELDAVQKQSDVHARWLVGESSIYTSRVRGLLIKPHAFRPIGILRETRAGLSNFLRDSLAGEARSPWLL
jgi:hypothetical protein